jgi:MFS family permease
VAISAPFFALYMLRDLQFTYLQYSFNSIASIATQFVMLRYWGRIADRFGNHAVMVICSCIIPAVPLLWLLSPNYYYLIVVQMVSGLCWSGFTLCTINYLYDIRPHQTNFALYAAVQSGTSALLVFAGGMLGGYVARHAPEIAATLAALWQPDSVLFVVFVTSALLRVVVVVGFVPRLKEPTIRKRPSPLEVIVRITRFNAITGVALDWMSVTRKSDDSDQS